MNWILKRYSCIHGKMTLETSFITVKPLRYPFASIHLVKIRTISWNGVSSQFIKSKNFNSQKPGIS